MKSSGERRFSTSSQRRDKAAAATGRPILLAALCFLAGLVISGCGIHGLHLQQSPLFKYLVSKSGRIAYLGSDGNVYIVDQTGAGGRITSGGQSGGDNATTYAWPTWSPQGRNLAYAKNIIQPEGLSESQLFVVGGPKAERRRLFSSESLYPFYLVWSPNDKYLAVLSSSDEDSRIELGLVPTAGASDYRSLDAGSPYYVAWSPHGTDLLVHTNFTDRGGGRVSVIPVTAPGSRRNLGLRYGFFQAPAVTPAGQPVVSIASGAKGRRIVSIGPEREPTTISSTGRFVLFSLSPNGKYLTYLQSSIGSTNPTNTLHIVSRREPAKHLTVPLDPVIGYFWAPDSKEIAVFTTDSSSKPVDRIYSQDNSAPHVDLYVYELSARSDWRVARFPASQGLLSIFPYTDQYQKSETIWSPNDRYLVFTALTKDGGSGVFVVPADANLKPKEIGSGDYASWSRH